MINYEHGASNEANPSPEGEGRLPYINVKDIVEDNGKTVEQNNLARQHKIPIGALVEFKTDEWYGDGACERRHCRMFVIAHDRDCDGTPLYRVAPRKLENLMVSLDGERFRIFNDQEVHPAGKAVAKLFNHKINQVVSGLSEDSLTIIEVTPQIIEGREALVWPDESYGRAATLLSRFLAGENLRLGELSTLSDHLRDLIPIIDQFGRDHSQFDYPTLRQVVEKRYDEQYTEYKAHKESKDSQQTNGG